MTGDSMKTIPVSMFEPITLDPVNNDCVQFECEGSPTPGDRTSICLYKGEAEALRDALIELYPLPALQTEAKPHFYTQGRTVYQTQYREVEGVWVAKFASNKEAQAYVELLNAK